MNKEVEKIIPKCGIFTNYIFKTIPLAFDESMSYYETLCGLLYYLKNTILPTIDNNADAVIELQNLFTQLQEYVNNYFDNLDVQEEINNKLDEMALDGTIENILSQIVNVNEKLYYYVEDYGATGDGVTDDSVAINEAFLDAKNKKGVVAFKTQNKYKIDSPIYIPQGCSLNGNGCTIISNCENGEYAIYVNSTAEDNSTETTGRSFSIVEHFTLESANNDFIENANGIHFACHGIVQNIIFYKIDKCVRFAHPLYIDRFQIINCMASTRTLSTNYAFDLGNNGDTHEIINVQHSNTGSTSEAQPKFIYIGTHCLNGKIENTIGSGLIDVRGECTLNNIMLTYYGKINVQTPHKNVTINNVYASTDYIKEGRITSTNNHILNLNNCRFINSALVNEFATGNPISYSNTDHIYLNQCTLGNRFDTNSNYGTIDMAKLYGYDMINPSIKNENADFTTSHTAFSLLSDIAGTLNGTFTYKSRVVYDKSRLIGKSVVREKTIEASNKGVRASNFSKNLPIYLTREAENNETVSAYIYPTNNLFVDQGNNVSGCEWTSNLLDVANLNTGFNKLIFNDINVIAYTDNNFSTPNGTWTKNDIIIAGDGIYKYDGTNWLTL